MKIVLALIAFVSAFAEPYSYTITEHPYRFSTYYEMQGKNGFEGRGIKNFAPIRTSYLLQDANGLEQAQGVVQTFSLGALFAWGKDIDIYDPAGRRIGFIDGEVLTTASAKYSFYDESNRWVATAYLDYSCSGFVLTSSQNERTIGHLKRKFVDNATDFWEVTIYDPGAIDLRLVRIFSIFAVDYQSYFREDR